MPTDCKERMLIWAAKSRNLAEVKRLITDCGINPNIQDVDGSTPLHVATQYGYPDVVELLLEYGADPNARIKYGDTPLHYAVKEISLGNFDVVRLLLEHGADLNARDDRGWTPLHEAAFHCNYGAAGILIDHGADPTIKDNEGRTPSDVFRERWCSGVSSVLAERIAARLKSFMLDF